MRNLQYCSYGASAIFLTDDFDKAESKFQEVAMKVGAWRGGTRGVEGGG
jgi:hypothetical protein